jgi:hypothetical protein
MSAGSPKSPPPSPDELRAALRELGEEPPSGERDFAAGLHRRLVAAGAPRPAWRARVACLWQDLWRDRPQRRSLLTGAVLGALVTAVVLTLLSPGARDRQEADGQDPSAPEACAPDVVATPVVPAGTTEHHGHAVGDRRPTRDRMGAFIGAERPERAAHTREKH